jgi:hypothetical protein
MKVAKIYSDISKVPGIGLKNFLPITSNVVSNISGMIKDIPTTATQKFRRCITFWVLTHHIA